MGTGASSIDVKRYSQGNPTPPGVYNVRVFINQQSVASLELPFVDIGENSAAACITLKNLAQLHIKQPEYPITLLAREGEEGDCLDIKNRSSKRKSAMTAVSSIWKSRFRRLTSIKHMAVMLTPHFGSRVLMPPCFLTH